MVPDGKPLADYLPTLIIKAKDFATEITSHNVIEKDLKAPTQFLPNTLRTKRLFEKCWCSAVSSLRHFLRRKTSIP